MDAKSHYYWYSQLISFISRAHSEQFQNSIIQIILKDGHLNADYHYPYEIVQV